MRGNPSKSQEHRRPSSPDASHGGICVGDLLIVVDIAVDIMNVNKLSSLIDGKRITKASIIKKAGISRPALDAILNGSDFKVSNLEKIAMALGVPVGYFFDESDRPFIHAERGCPPVTESGDMSTVHLGKEIGSRLNELKISKVEFARRIGTSKQNIGRILEKKTMDTANLMKYSEALGCNFFDLFASPASVHTEGDYSPASESGDVSVVVGDALMAERVRSLEAQLSEKTARIDELKERIDELKERIDELKKGE